MVDTAGLVQYHKDADNNAKEVFNKIVNTISNNYFDKVELMPKSSKVVAKYDGIADKVLLLVLKHVVEPAKINKYLLSQEQSTEEDLTKDIKQIDMAMSKMQSLSEQIKEKADEPIFMGKLINISRNFSQDKVLSKFPMLYNPEYSFVTTELNAGNFSDAIDEEKSEETHTIVYVIVGNKGFNMLSFDTSSNAYKTNIMLPRSLGYQVLGYSPLITTISEEKDNLEEDEEDRTKNSNKKINIRCVLVKQLNSIKKILPKSYNMITGAMYDVPVEVTPKVS